ncbi:MAG: LysR family transcriptional regulator [Stigonema ocellatum SAG 48.90 = DSM 106950]|nr:LysR family transcriptional regulator [Stigonema ocellatum SAG 48.90 = DSM 106950]
MKSIELSSVDLNLLVAFEALFEERSVTGAAQRLYLGQPAMSAALGRLRTLFEDELFIRIGREMQPTSKALEIAPGILAALDQIRQTLEASQTFDPATTERSFTIGSSDYTSFVVVPKLLAFFQQFAPGINVRLIGFEKNSVGELLEQGSIDLALGVFPNPPQQTLHEPLFEEQFVGIARKKHPAISNKTLSLETFAELPHALVTIRRDETGFIDQVLLTHSLKRRIAVTTPHMLVLPSIVASSDLIASLPSRIATHVECYGELKQFELPIETASWTISMLWSKLVDKDSAITWLRQALRTISSTL